MKPAVPNDILIKVDHPERRSKRSRLARHAPDEIADAINPAIEDVGDQRDEFVASAAHQVLEKTEW